MLNDNHITRIEAALKAGPMVYPFPSYPIRGSDIRALLDRLKAAEVDAARFRALEKIAKEQLLNPRHALSDFMPDMRTYWALPTFICSGPVGGFKTFRESVDSYIQLQD